MRVNTHNVMMIGDNDEVDLRTKCTAQQQLPVGIPAEAVHFWNDKLLRRCTSMYDQLHA